MKYWQINKYCLIKLFYIEKMFSTKTITAVQWKEWKDEGKILFDKILLYWKRKYGLVKSYYPFKLKYNVIKDSLLIIFVVNFSQLLSLSIIQYFLIDI